MSINGTLNAEDLENFEQAQPLIDAWTLLKMKGVVQTFSWAGYNKVWFKGLENNNLVIPFRNILQAFVGSCALYYDNNGTLSIFPLLSGKCEL